MPITGVAKPRFSAIQITLANQQDIKTVSEPKVLSVDLLAPGQTDEFFEIGATTKFPNPDSLLLIATKDTVEEAESSYQVGEFDSIGELTREYQTAWDRRRGRELSAAQEKTLAKKTKAVLAGLQMGPTSDERLKLIEYDPPRSLLSSLKANKPDCLDFFRDGELTHLNWRITAGQLWDKIQAQVLGLLDKSTPSSAGRHYDFFIGHTPEVDGLRWET